MLRSRSCSTSDLQTAQQSALGPGDTSRSGAALRERKRKQKAGKASGAKTEGVSSKKRPRSVERSAERSTARFVNGKRVYVGDFVNEDAAARAYDAAVRKHFPGEKKPDRWVGYNLAEGSGEARGAGRRTGEGTSSRHRGVYWSKSRKKWRASISANNKRKWLGTFVDEDDAARAYDAAVRKHYPGDKPVQGRAYNLAGSGSSAEVGSFAEVGEARLRRRRREFAAASRNAHANPRLRSPQSSSYRGVSWDNRGKKWRADIRVDGKKKWLGNFAGEVVAARAYDAAVRKYYPGDKSLYPFLRWKGYNLAGSDGSDDASDDDDDDSSSEGGGSASRGALLISFVCSLLFCLLISFVCFKKIFCFELKTRRRGRVGFHATAACRGTWNSRSGR